MSVRSAALLVAAAAFARVVGGAALLFLLDGPRWIIALWLMLNVRVRMLYPRPPKSTEPPGKARRGERP